MTEESQTKLSSMQLQAEQDRKQPSYLRNPKGLKGKRIAALEMGIDKDCPILSPIWPVYRQPAVVHDQSLLHVRFLAEQCYLVFVFFGCLGCVIAGAFVIRFSVSLITSIPDDMMNC